MVERIDVRGLSCPHPVILVHRRMHEMGTGTFEVIGDDETARMNLIRLCNQRGWEYKEEEEEDDEFVLIISKVKG